MTHFKRDENGAVMVMGLFAGVFLVAVLYHLSGVGSAALENSLMQDAADSVAWSAATVKARGMNTIALINLVMATVLSVLVAIRLVQVVIGAAIVAVGVACLFTGGAACGAAAPLVVVQQKLSTLADQLQTPVHEILRGLEQASSVVNRAVPVLAQAEAVYISRQESPGVSMIGATLPVFEALPTEPGDFPDLCEQAGRQVVYVSTFFLPGNLPSRANDIVGGLIGKMASGFSRFFCGGGGERAPAMDSRADTAYPIAADVSCDDSGARPSSIPLECHSNLCDRCTRLACTLCSDRIGTSSYREGQWLLDENHYLEIRDSHGGISRQQTNTDRRLAWIDGDPCQGRAICDADEVCRTERRSGPLLGSDETRITETVYRRIVGCRVEEPMSPVDMPDALESSAWPVHRQLKSDAEASDFRVVGLVSGRNRQADRLHALARMTRSAAVSKGSGRIGFAAAEFTSPGQDLWHMDWYSRLVRFRMNDLKASASDCSGAFAEECGRLQDALREVFDFSEDWILH